MNASKIELTGWICLPMDSTETSTPMDSPTGLVGAHMGLKTPYAQEMYEGHDNTPSK